MRKNRKQHNHGKSIVMVAACPFPANRGTPSRILRMAESLSDIGYDVHVVTYHIGDGIKVRGIKIHRIPKVLTYKKMSAGPAYQKPILDFLLLIKLMYVVKKEHISFIHAHHYEGAFIGWLVKKIRRDSILIYDCHASLSEEMVQFKFLARYKWMRSWWQCVERFINTHNDFTIAVSEELANTVVEQDGPKEKVAVIPMGVNLEDFANNSVTNEDLRKIHNLGDSRLVMYTGNLSPIQGIENLLSAFSRVAEKLKNVKLVIVGNTELQKYKDLTTTMGLSENVIFTGEKAFDYVPSYLALADVLVSPRTNCPGTPQKLANYMASGKPIVAFKGSAKGLVNEINGLVVENGDIDGFADAIVKTLTDQILATKISEGAKCSAQSLDWPELVKKIDSIYNIELNYV